MQTGSTYDSRFNMCIKIVSVTALIAANALAYVSDLCMSNDTERFKEVMYNIYAGDCEDLAFFIDDAPFSTAQRNCRRKEPRVDLVDLEGLQTVRSCTDHGISHRSINEERLCFE